MVFRRATFPPFATANQTIANLTGYGALQVPFKAVQADFVTATVIPPEVVKYDKVAQPLPVAACRQRPMTSVIGQCDAENVLPAL
jgi:hypothetical protein